MHSIPLLLLLLAPALDGDAVNPGETPVSAAAVPPDVHSSLPKSPETSAATDGYDYDTVGWTITLSYELKNLSIGPSFRYLDYVETQVTTDYLLTALLMGFGLDDLNAIRFNLAQTVAAELKLDPSFHLETRFGHRPQAGPIPHLVVGAGVWGVVEIDSLGQIFRLGDTGLFLGATAGMFATFVFSAIDVTFAYRPFSTTAYFLDGAWDTTGVQFGNPIVEISLSYVLPW